MYKPILITGCARSGTSLVAGIFNLCGAFGGDMSGPTNWNKKGMFENAYIREKLVKPYLEINGADPMGQNPLPDQDTLKTYPEWGQEIMSVLRAEGYGSGPFFYKGAKMCLMWKQWHLSFPWAIWIIVRRPDEQIINSCLKTPFMRKRQTREEWQEWIDYHKERFEELESFGAIEVWSSDIISGDLIEIKNAIVSCGLTWNEEAVRDFIDTDLWSGQDDIPY